MRAKMKKLLFLGTENAHEQFFEKAQKIGAFEFISLSNKKVFQLPKGLEDLKLAIKVLRRYPHETGPKRSLENGQVIVDQILVLKREIENLHEELKLLDTEIIKMSPLGHFEMQDITRIRNEIGKNVSFYFTRRGRVKEEQIPKGLIFISHFDDLDYYMYIGDEPFYNSAFNELMIRKSLTDLRLEKKRVEETLHERQIHLRKKAIYQDFLYDLFLEEMNQFNLQNAKDEVETYLEERLFAVEAWVAHDRLNAAYDLISGLPIYAEEIAPSKGETIPTHLENSGSARIGQDFVEGYDMPSSTDKDPSPWVIWAFAVFFGMIISDAGYGFIFFLLSAFLWYKFPKLKGVKRRMLKLLTILSISSIIWGMLIASYFSIVFAPSSVGNRSSMLYNIARYKIEYHLDHKDETYKGWLYEYPKLSRAKTPMQVLETGVVIKESRVTYPLMDEIYNSLLLEISLLVGMIHLSLSFLRNLYRSYSGIGWVLMMWGGYLFFPKILDVPTFCNYFHLMTFEMSTFVGEIIFYSGLSLAVGLAIIQSGISGLASLFKVIEIFADALSYLRLYALGLASVVMAKTFNEIGVTIGGYMFGWLIILIGHAVNIQLSVMAGVIHGLRLNFLEWYHHSFEGGGKKFNPLRLLIRE